MKQRRKLLLAVLAAFGLFIVFSAESCGEAESDRSSQLDRVQRKASQRIGYEPINDVEFNNYNRAQRLYDSPTTIIWCSTTWGNASAPIITMPVAGKLTSSSVSLFPNQVIRQYGESGSYNPELPSVDGMYHGSPPPYRYGFTPGGQYIDFFNMPTVCTTALTSFQRESTRVDVSVDPRVAAAQKDAERALDAGLDRSTGVVDRAAQDEAERILKEAVGGN